MIVRKDGKIVGFEWMGKVHEVNQTDTPVFVWFTETNEPKRVNRRHFVMPPDIQPNDWMFGKVWEITGVSLMGRKNPPS